MKSQLLSVKSFLSNKNIFRLALIALLISTFISCQKNDESAPSTGAALDRDKFKGTWHVTSHHSPSGQTLHWDMTIVDGSTSSEIWIDNFDQMGSTNFVRATVSGNSFSIAHQSAPPDTTFYQGSGSYSNNTLSFNYTADDQANPVDNVSATANR